MKLKVIKKKMIIILMALIVLYFILAIPGKTPDNFTPADKQPFIWNLDTLWSALEKSFREARQRVPHQLKEEIDRGLGELDLLLELYLKMSVRPGPDHEIFERMETQVFNLAPLVAAYSSALPDYIQRCNRLRQMVKGASIHWDMNRREARDRVYRLLYGSRSALEEVMLQAPAKDIPALVKVADVPSQTPVASILGVNIHSGDILVSRGGAATSALISRGNDYPGNFSHIALVHVDPKTHLASIIEAHIEIGVAIANLEQYLRDKKLRVMVMRLRPDLPALEKDPMLPHKAAQYALDDARRRHIPYDFQMDYNNPDKLFCSEVASAAYKKMGVNLWMGISTISSPGLASWLSAFGVTHFRTQEPSDLEYDPQLRVVAEWRDPDTLYHDHLDNAVIDIMLEGAEKGDRLTHAWYLLPLARVLKGYSMLLNLFGGSGPVPEGMSASAALKNQRFSKLHKRIKKELIQRAGDFKKEHGYTPPYWELLKLIRESL